MIQTSAINTIMDAMIDVLTQHLITEVTISNPSDPRSEAVAGVLRAGKLQDDPTFGEVNILIHPSDDQWAHQLLRPSDASGYTIPATYEMRPGIPSYYQLRRYVVELKLFFDNELDREVAQIKANVVLSRVQYAIHSMNTSFKSIRRDSFGEKPHAVQVSKSWMREGGGPGTFIWRGQVFVEFVTHTEPPASLS